MFGAGKVGWRVEDINAWVAALLAALRRAVDGHELSAGLHDVFGHHRAAR
jgi:hypothetical protein